MSGQVITCSMTHFWYRNYVGRTFEILGERENSYRVKHPVYPGISLYIAKNDLRIKQ